MTEAEIKFAKDQIQIAKYIDSLPRAKQIEELCDMAACNDKLRKIHMKQYLDRRWNPHPSERFVRWWANRGVAATEEATNRGWATVDSEQAYNCEVVREVYRDFLKDQRMDMQGAPF